MNISPHRLPNDSIENLDEEMSKISVTDEGDKLYKVLANTKWKIKTSVDDDNKKSCSEKYCLSKLGGIDSIIRDLRDVLYNVLASDYINGTNYNF